ncbi:Alpha-glucosidase 2 [Tolypocladium ophioglossoides CBS 100239]|uniref:alpha-glucosidase n=1 Tax=Tolypocladium ophioglossoides (strain CBS 100239) TaxID=1163406 RepID=A0A0L0MY46_TOLOC|nr:Alpha-glucosidase 2 [Tolypocladium ophioglossoides CBS 100239]
MPGQNGRIPCGYVLVDEKSHVFAFKLQSTAERNGEQFEFFFECARDNIFHTAFSSATHPLPPHPSAKKPQRIYAAKAAPEYMGNTAVRFETATARVCVEWQHTPVVTIYIGDSETPIHRDISDRSYVVDGPGTSHYFSYHPGALHVGLGDESSSLDLSGRMFIVGAGDAAAHDGRPVDPLYKHIPLVISLTPQGCVGVFSKAYSRAMWSIGCEMHAGWGSCSALHQAHGGLEEYIIIGRNLDEVVWSYAQVVGFPPLIPRYMLGHIAGDLHASTSDRPPAWVKVLEYIRRCRHAEIPISAFHLGHGYAAPENPYAHIETFAWNKNRFPDPRWFIRACHDSNVRLLAATTPFVLFKNRAHRHLAEAGAFFTAETSHGHPATFRRRDSLTGKWSEASLLDFTSAAATRFWLKCVKALGEMGIDGISNDHNDFTDVNANCLFRLDSDALEAPTTQRQDVELWGRALHTDLLNQASRRALVAARPNERPLILTHSVAPGTMRHATSSWSGDNLTSWQSMREGSALTLSAGFSLIHSYGHDVGGSCGAKPGRQLFVRWVQLAVYSPRFVINCNTTSPTGRHTGERGHYPWTYPELLPLLRDAIHRRYELIPYLYSLALESHLVAKPLQRWTGWGYESDPEVWKQPIKGGAAQYWLGDALLVCGIYEQHASSVRVYLPKKSLGAMYDYGFLNTNAPYQRLEAGRWHTIHAPWKMSIAVLARIGSVVPVGRACATTCVGELDPEFPAAAKDDWRGVEIFPVPLTLQLQGEPAWFNAKDWWLEDDGISPQSKAAGSMVRVVVHYRIMTAQPHCIQVGVTLEMDGSWAPLWVEHGIEVILPPEDVRAVVNLPDWHGWKEPRLLRRDEKQRSRWRVQVRIFRGGMFPEPATPGDTDEPLTPAQENV